MGWGNKVFLLVMLVFFGGPLDLAIADEILPDPIELPAQGKDGNQNQFAESKKKNKFLDYFYFDGSLFEGPVFLSRTPQGGKRPFLLQTGLGVTVGGKWKGFIAGLCSDYRFINQFSEVTPSTGNMRGTRWNSFSPMLGYKFKKLIIKGDFQWGALQFVGGSYVLSQQTTTLIDVKYTLSWGARFNAMTNLFFRNYAISSFDLAHLHWGGFVEYARFNEQVLSNVPVNTKLSTPLTMWQVGLSFGYVL